MKNGTYLSLWLLVVLYMVANNLVAQKKERPNVIIIFTDDQGYQDLACYGAEGISTPNIDRLAASGTKFTDFYVAASVCSPSRAALLTGCYPKRISMTKVLFPPGPWWTKGKTDIGLNPEEQTIAELLKEKNYATACIGKWHLGHLKPFLPLNQGFDEYFGLPYSNDMRPEHNEKYPALPLMDGFDVVEENSDQSSLTTRYTQKAVDFIKRKKDVPFFLYLAHSMPHIPIYVSDKFKGNSQRGLYGDVIAEIDWSVGEIIKTLKESGIYKNTLVVFTSDNGPWLVFGNHGGLAKPLREGKGTTFDGGMRIPCIMSWPGKIPEGKVCGELASTLDLLPTISAITGANLPDKKIDGLDISKLIFSEKVLSSPRKSFFYYRHENLQAVRYKNWKLHLPHNYSSVKEAGRDGKIGVAEKKEIGLALFDLSTDIGEKTNLAEKRPKIVRKLKKIAKEFDAQLIVEKRACGKIN